MDRPANYKGENAVDKRQSTHPGGIYRQAWEELFFLGGQPNPSSMFSNATIGLLHSKRQFRKRYMMPPGSEHGPKLSSVKKSRFPRRFGPVLPLTTLCYGRGPAIRLYGGLCGYLLDYPGQMVRHQDSSSLGSRSARTYLLYPQQGHD